MFKSVLFFVCIIAASGVFGKTTLRKAGPGPIGGSFSGSSTTTTTTSGSVSTPPPQVLDPNVVKPSPFGGEIHKFKNLIADAQGVEQELAEGERAEVFAEFVKKEFERADKSKDGKIDLDEYKGRLNDVSKRYFISADFVDAAISAYAELNYNNEGESKDVLDEEEFAGLIYVALEQLVEQLEEIKEKKPLLEKVYNIRAFLEDLRPDENFPCDVVVSNNDLAEYLKRRVRRIPLKVEALNSLLKDLTGTTPRNCDDLKKSAGDRLSKLVKPIEEVLGKVSLEAGLNVSAGVSLLKSRKGTKKH